MEILPVLAPGDTVLTAPTFGRVVESTIVDRSETAR